LLTDGCMCFCRKGAFGYRHRADVVARPAATSCGGFWKNLLTRSTMFTTRRACWMWKIDTFVRLYDVLILVTRLF